MGAGAEHGGSKGMNLRPEGLKHPAVGEVAEVGFITTSSVLLLALLFVLGACNRSASGQVIDVSAQDILGIPVETNGPVLVDVRTPSEYASGHVPHAINIPLSEVAHRLTELVPHKEQSVVLYCEQGGRALKAAAILVSAGFPKVQHLRGDMSAWRAAGFPSSAEPHIRTIQHEGRLLGQSSSSHPGRAL
jgi:rhodanese-related sulfurtransferase